MLFSPLTAQELSFPAYAPPFWQNLCKPPKPSLLKGAKRAGIKDLDSDVNRRRALQLVKTTKEINFDNMENIYVEMFNSVYKPLALKKAREEQEKM